MNRRVLKCGVLAALFSAAFFIGENSVEAYTYSGVTSTIDKVAEDESDLIIKNSNVIVKNTIAPSKEYSKKVTVKNASSISCAVVTGAYDSYGWGTHTYVCLKYMPTTMSEKMYTEFGDFVDNPSKEKLLAFNAKYNTKIEFYSDVYNSDIDKSYADTNGKSSWGEFKSALSYDNGLSIKQIGSINQQRPISHGVMPKKDENTITYTDYQVSDEDAAIIVSNKSTLTSKSNVQTTAAINVTDGSFLKAAGSITGEDIYSDKAIISTTNDQGESIIAPGNITAAGALKSDTYIGAWSGAVSGKTVYSGGDVVSANSIQAGGLAKGNILNVAAINAASASITGNQSISGVFTATGQAKLNGGAALGNKKVTGLLDATLSATSTEAVNGAQLNTIKQKLASVGKTYSAGSDVAISSANAISVAKKGVVDKGDTGIVTGGTVYKITSALNSSLGTLKASVSAHQSTLTTLTQGLSDLKASVTNINQSVASATKSLSSQLNNRLQSDMGNLSNDGKNVIRSMVSSTLKSMNSMSVSDSNLSPVATYEAQEKASGNAASQVTKKDTDDIQNELNNKANTSELTSLNEVVSGNTKQLTANANSIHANEVSIANLKETKADVTGSNIEVGKYAEKLGIGKVEAGNKELVTGNTIHTALGQKADVSYVESGLGMMSNQLDSMSQGLTRDMNRMGAGTAALAGLHPTSYDASDKLSFAYGGGHYKNVNTSALGAFYHPNDKTMVSVAGTIGNADTMLSAGVSIKLGLNHNVKQVMITPKMFSAQEVTNQGMKDQLDSQSEELKQIEAALQSMVR